MPQLKHKDCFANMLPEGPGHELRDSSAGKALAWQSIPSGGLSSPERRVEIDIAEWDDCRQCDEFDSCYRLSMAKLSLASVLHLN